MVKRNDTSGYMRKTSRVLAIEASKKAKQLQSQKAANNALSQRIPKKIRLDDGPQSQQEKGMINFQAPPFGKAILPSDQQVPDKEILEFVIDVLQRRDKYGYFAEPVDGDEVEEYYDFIKEPMDFGTMRAKLHERIYITLKQFQDDVYLISNNALSFNSSSTIYYREARAIHELADRIFSTLKTNPENIIEEFSKKKIHVQQSKYEIEGSGAKHEEKTKPKRLAHCRLSEPKNWKNPTFNEAGWRHTYQPPTSKEETYLCSPKHLVLANDDESQQFGWKESLKRFVKGLGPVAQKVANQKLKLLNQMRSPALLVPYEIQKYANYENSVVTDRNIPLANHSSDPGRKSKMMLGAELSDNRVAETNFLSQLNSDLPSFVSPRSSVYPSTIVHESSYGLSGNLYRPSYKFPQMQQQPLNPLGTKKPYFKPLNLLGTQNSYLQPLNPLGTQNSYLQMLSSDQETP